MSEQGKPTRRRIVWVLVALSIVAFIVAFTINLTTLGFKISDSCVIAFLAAVSLLWTVGGILDSDLAIEYWNPLYHALKGNPKYRPIVRILTVLTGIVLLAALAKGILDSLP